MSDVIKELKLELWVVHKRDWKFDLKMTLFFIFNFFQQVELVRDRKAVRSWARCSFWTPNCFSILKNYFYHIILQKIKKTFESFFSLIRSSSFPSILWILKSGTSVSWFVCFNQFSTSSAVQVASMLYNDC